MAERRLAAPGAGLTGREIEVLSLVMLGKDNAEVGRELGLYGSTVKSHMVRIGRKLGAGDRAGIVGRAIRTGQIVIPVTGAVPLGFNERHFDVLVRIARGMSNQEIAADLHLSVHTVKSRVARLLRLLEVDSREAAVAAGFACGVLRLVPRQWEAAR